MSNIVINGVEYAPVAKTAKPAKPAKANGTKLANGYVVKSLDYLGKDARKAIRATVKAVPLITMREQSQAIRQAFVAEAKRLGYSDKAVAWLK